MVNRDPERTVSDRQFEKWSEEVKPFKSDLDLMIMEYLIATGYPQTAANFAQEAGTAGPPDVGHIEARLEIRHCIHRGEIMEAITKINELDPQLLDQDTSLHFSLLRLQLTEITRAGLSAEPEDPLPAIMFARRNLTPMVIRENKFMDDLNKSMALVICPPDRRTASLQYLLEPKMRESIADDVNKALIGSSDKKNNTRLESLLRTRAYAESAVRESGFGVPDNLTIGLDRGSEHARDAQQQSRRTNGNGCEGGAVVGNGTTESLME